MYRIIYQINKILCAVQFKCKFARSATLYSQLNNTGGFGNVSPMFCFSIRVYFGWMNRVSFVLGVCSRLQLVMNDLWIFLVCIISYVVGGLDNKLQYLFRIIGTYVQDFFTFVNGYWSVFDSWADKMEKSVDYIQPILAGHKWGCCLFLASFCLICGCRVFANSNICWQNR